MEKILVVGAGFMGSGIAQVCAQKGKDVFLTDTSTSAIERGLKEIGSSLVRLAQKNIITEDPDRILKRITPVDGIETASLADLIIEAATESEEIKKSLFARLDSLASHNSVIASNTSSIPISILASSTSRPENVLGMHFFGPVPLMRLVEVVKAEHTSADVFERAVSFVKSLDKIPVKVMKDIPGFIMNRIFSAALREALELVEKGVASPEDVDIGMREGYGWRAGPFEIADNAGLDTIELIGKALERLGAGSLSPRSEILSQLVSEGRLGRKSGRGFYDYDPAGKRKTKQN